MIKFSITQQRVTGGANRTALVTIMGGTVLILPGSQLNVNPYVEMEYLLALNYAMTTSTMNMDVILIVRRIFRDLIVKEETYQARPNAKKYAETG